MSVCRLHVMPILLSAAPISKVLTNAHVLRDFVLRTQRKRNVLVCTETNHILLVEAALYYSCSLGTEVISMQVSGVKCSKMAVMKGSDVIITVPLYWG